LMTLFLKLSLFQLVSSSFTFCLFFNDISPKMIYCNVIMIFGFIIQNEKYMNTHIFLLISKNTAEIYLSM
jgi:hypothetical protein